MMALPWISIFAHSVAASGSLAKKADTICKLSGAVRVPRQFVFHSFEAGKNRTLTSGIPKRSAWPRSVPCLYIVQLALVSVE